MMFGKQGGGIEKMIGSAEIGCALKQYLVDVLEKCGLYIGKAIETYPVLVLFEVYYIYEEEHELLSFIPDIREQIERGKYNQDTYAFLKERNLI